MKATAPKITLTQIKARVPIDIALQHYNVALKAHGNRLFAPCPIHGGSNPRGFVVSPDRRSWYCFGDCSAGGTVLDLIMKLEECALAEAADILITRYRLT